VAIAADEGRSVAGTVTLMARRSGKVELGEGEAALAVGVEQT